MKIIATVALTAGLALGLAPQADARPIHHTARVQAGTGPVDTLAVMKAEFTEVVDPSSNDHMEMVRFELNNGSIWLSPNDDCLGPRHRMCQIAWQKARKARFFSQNPHNPTTDGAR